MNGIVRLGLVAALVLAMAPAEAQRSLLKQFEAEFVSLSEEEGHSVSACAGPMAVCPWNGTAYSASTTCRALASAASGSPCRTGSSVDVGVAFRM